MADLVPPRPNLKSPSGKERLESDQNAWLTLQDWEGSRGRETLPSGSTPHLNVVSTGHFRPMEILPASNCSSHPTWSLTIVSWEATGSNTLSPFLIKWWDNWPAGPCNACEIIWPVLTKATAVKTQNSITYRANFQADNLYSPWTMLCLWQKRNPHPWFFFPLISNLNW